MHAQVASSFRALLYMLERVQTVSRSIGKAAASVRRHGTESMASWSRVRAILHFLSCLYKMSSGIITKVGALQDASVNEFHVSGEDIGVSPQEAAPSVWFYGLNLTLI